MAGSSSSRKNSIYGKIISVDIKDMDAIDNVHFINADFSKKETIQKISSLFEGK